MLLRAIVACAGKTAVSPDNKLCNSFVIAQLLHSLLLTLKPLEIAHFLR